MEQPTDDTPSVSHSLDSSLREGAGNGLCHSSYRPETGRLRAIFIAPTKLRDGDIIPFTEVHSLSLASLDSSLREGAGKCSHSSGCSLKSGVTGDFHRPYEGRVSFTVPPGNRDVAGAIHRFQPNKWAGGWPPPIGGCYCSTSNLYPTPQTVFRFHLGLTPSSFSRRRFTWTSTVRESPK